MTDLIHGWTGIFGGKHHLSKRAEEMRNYFGVRHLFFASSGKASLYLILQALTSLSTKQQVIIPAYTCFSVPAVIVRAGLKVVLCDLRPGTFELDHERLEHIINDDTLCVIPTHLFGIPSNMGPIRRLCRDRGIFVVEDAAQAMGGWSDGQQLGTSGDVGFFSLGRGKALTCGSGGIVVTDSDQIGRAIGPQYASLPRPTMLETIAEYVRVVITSILIHPMLYWLPAGLPFLKLGRTVFDTGFAVTAFSGIKAGLLYRWRARLEQANRVRVEVSAYYRQQLQCAMHRNTSIPYLRFPLLVRSHAKRERLCAQSRERGLGIGLMYPTAINEIPELRGQFKGQQFPVAQDIAKRLLTVPTHQLLTTRDRNAICELLIREQVCEC